MTPQYNYSTLKKILGVKIGNKLVWKKRLKQQSQFVYLLEEAFGTEMTTQAFAFYPGSIYFATPLTTDPKYTQRSKPLWNKIKKAIESYSWEVYTPFSKSNPHAKLPDNLTSYQIRDLDHIRVLTGEVALFDLNRPSHGVGQEIEMSVFMPSIGFSQERVSRLVKGMPGMLILQYKDEKELMKLIRQIFSRESYKKEPFYLDICANHPTKSVFKGKECLNCLFATNLHPA